MKASRCFLLVTEVASVGVAYFLWVGSDRVESACVTLSLGLRVFMSQAVCLFVSGCARTKVVCPAYVAPQQSDSWDKGLEDRQVAWKTDLPRESWKGLFALKHDSRVGTGAESKALRLLSSTCAEPAVGVGYVCLKPKEKRTSRQRGGLMHPQ